MKKIKPKLGIVFIIYLGTFLFSCQSDMKFESAKWRKSGGENITLDLRKNMVNDLIESGILINKSETEISELIANPERLANRDTAYKRFYPVQEIYGWNIDPEEMTYLEIEFDKQGISRSVKFISTK